MNINWSAFEAKVLAIIEKVMTKIMKRYCEKWVTAEVLCEHVGTLTPRFLKDHGKMFNRTQVIWKDPQGVEHAQGWLYPLHEILEMIEDGRIKELKETTK